MRVARSPASTDMRRSAADRAALSDRLRRISATVGSVRPAPVVAHRPRHATGVPGHAFGMSGEQALKKFHWGSIGGSNNGTPARRWVAKNSTGTSITRLGARRTSVRAVSLNAKTRLRGVKKFRWNSTKIRPETAKIGPESTKIGPESAKVGLESTKIGRPRLARSQPRLDRNPPNLARSASTLVRLRFKLVPIRPTSARNWSGSTTVGPEAAEVGPEFDQPR